MTYSFNRIIGDASPKAILKKILIFLMLSWELVLTSCSTAPQNTLPRSTKLVINQAQQAGFNLNRVGTSTFLLTTYARLPNTSTDIVHVYIEGDGNSWKTRYKLSNNPTPKQPLALQLALADPHPHVIYIARPCQYTPHEEDIHCKPAYWSSHRYSNEVIQSTNEVLDQIKASVKNTHFLLVGFSGGASVAALVTARRQDVAKLITVAGDLDHEALNHYHRTTPLQGSLNPTHYIEHLKNIPQVHWSGSDDEIVPSWVAKHFVLAANNPEKVKTQVLNGATHHRGWVKHWEAILKTSN